jgi:hypothetical protein
LGSHSQEFHLSLQSLIALPFMELFKAVAHNDLVQGFQLGLQLVE